MFPSTHWSFVTSVRHADPEQRRQLVGSFLTRYAPPLRTHLAAQFPQINAADRDDLLQDFLTNHILQRSILDRADRERGKLRSFLRVSLNNHTKTWLAKHRRDPLRQAHSIEYEVGEEAVSEDLSFDLAWAGVVLTEAVVRFKDDCADHDRTREWDVFDLRLLRPALLGTQAVEYRELAKRYDVTPRQLENQLITAKRRFSRILRDIVSSYTASDEETEEEIRELRRIAFSAAPGSTIESAAYE